MNCAEIRELIQLYMDDELDARSTLAVQHHLESCSACSHLLGAYLKQDQALKQSAHSEVIDSRAVREMILAAIQNQSPAAGNRWWLRLTWSRVAAIIVLVIISALLVLRGEVLLGTSGNVYAAVTSDHNDHCSVNMVAGAITDSDELNKLAAVYSKMSAPPDLSAFGYANPRARICTVDGAEFLHLVYYNAEQLPISLFVRPHSPNLIDGRLNILHHGNYRVASVSRSGVDLLVVASMDDEQASAIVNAIAAQM